MRMHGATTRAFSIFACTGILAGCDSGTPTQPRVAARIEAISTTFVTATVFHEVLPAPSVRVLDSDGHPIGGLDVYFWKEGGSTRAVTNDAGVASIPWRLSMIAGRQAMKVIAGDHLPTGRITLTFTALAVAGPAVAVTSLDTSQSAPEGTTYSLRARVADRYGNPVPGVQVVFAVESGGGTLASPSPQSDSLGIARAAWNLGSDGLNSVTATIAGAAPARFTARALQAPVYYDLEAVAPHATRPSSWIALAGDGRFATAIDSVTGSGTYRASEGKISFVYSNDFLFNLAVSASWWPFPHMSATDEGGSFASDVIVIRRCYTDDCYEADWVYRKRAR